MKFRPFRKRWRMKFVRKVDKADSCGECDDRKGRILIKEGMKEALELDTLIHEMLHAADYTAKEKWVGKTATEIAKTLRALGWVKRKCGP